MKTHLMYRLAFFHVIFLASNVNTRCSSRDTKSKPDLSTVLDSQKPERTDVLKPQAGFCSDQEGDTGRHAIMDFQDETPAVACNVNTTVDPTRMSAYHDSQDFREFFKRPVRIYTGVWGVGAGYDVIIDPWLLWIQQKRVANRLSNFKNFRGNLTVKVLINGNGFYHGGMLISYSPLPALNITGFTTNATAVCDMYRASSRPHLWIDPTTSSGGSMVLPFFWGADYLNLTALPAAIGQLWLKQVNYLYHTGSSTQGLNIQIFAWCDNIELTSPTQTNVGGLVPQAGSIDEFGEGPISKPASVIAAAAGKIADTMPAIKPYALATQLGASAIGKMANVFGFSKPRDVERVLSVKHTQVSNLSYADCVDSTVALTFNSKQEVSVDPRFSGLSDQDEMDFKFIASKESLIGSFYFDQGDDVGTLIGSIPVSPMAAHVQSRTLPPTSEGFQLTPMGFVAQPFQYWRGTIHIRLQLTSSMYHKARLLVVWDPVVLKTTTTIADLPVVHSQIVDIAKCRDVTFKIGWGADSHYLGVGNFPSTATNPEFLLASRNIGTSNSAALNGRVGIYLLNELTTNGASTQPVNINVWMSCPDLEVFGPSMDKIQRLSPYPYLAPALRVGDEEEKLEPQAGVVTDQVNAENTFEKTEVLDMGGAGACPNASIWASGDPVKSFRFCAKRYTVRDVFAYTVTSVNDNFSVVSWTANNYPKHRGNNGVVTDKSPECALSYIAMAYSGWRGGVRYKIVPWSRPEGGASHWVVNRARTTLNTVPTQTHVLSANLPAFYSDYDGSWAGSAVSTTNMDGVLDFEVPYNSQARFDTTELAASAASNAMGFRVMAYEPSSLAGGLRGCTVYSAASDDWSVFFWMGVPFLWEVPY